MATVLLSPGLVSPSLEARAAPSGPAIKIGIEAPASGPDARFGTQIRTGVAWGIRDADASGGILGHPGTIVFEDDGGDPKRVADVAKQLVADEVSVVVGPFSSALAVPASAIYAQAGILDLLPSATAPVVTERGLRTVFRLCAREDAQASIAARYLADHVARIAIVFDRTSEGKALADAVRARLAALGRKDVFYGSFTKGSPDLAALVQRLRAAGAQAVFVGAGGADAGALARQIHDAGARTVVMGGLQMASDDFAAAAGTGAEGSLIVFPRDPRTRPAAADLLRRLTAAGESTETYVFYAYAAVQVLQQAARQADSLAPAAIAAALHEGPSFSTVLGDLRFDGKGDAEPSDLAVYVWRKGASGRVTFDDLAKS